MAGADILATAFGANDITVVRTANHEQNSYLQNLNKNFLQIPIKFAEKQQKKWSFMDANQSAEKRHTNVKSTPRKTVPRGLHGRSSQFPPQSERKNTKGKQNKLMR